MAWAAAEARAEAEAVRARAGEARATAKAKCEAARKAVEEAVKGVGATEEVVAAHVAAVEAFERDFTAAKLTPAEEIHLKRLRQEAQWSEAEELHLERLRAVMKERELKRQLQQAEEELQRLSLQTQSVSQAQSVPAWGLEHLGADCPICQEELGTAGDVVQLQCPQPAGANESAPHLFHLTCITHHAESWGKRGFPGTPGTQSPCPSCRAPMVQCRSVRTGKLHPLTAEAEAGQSAAPVTGPADRAALRQLTQLQQDLPQAPPSSARAERRFGPNYYEGSQSPSPSSARRGPSATAASTATASTPPRATSTHVTTASPTDAVDAAAASPAPAASAPASTDAPAPTAARRSPRPDEPPTSPMETDEPHTAPSTAVATADEGGGEGAASADPDEGVALSDLFSEDDEEGGGALSSPLTHALAPNA